MDDDKPTERRKAALGCLALLLLAALVGWAFEPVGDVLLAMLGMLWAFVGAIWAAAFG